MTPLSFCPSPSIAILRLSHRSVHTMASHWPGLSSEHRGPPGPIGLPPSLPSRQSVQGLGQVCLCVLESITPCGVLTDASPHHSGCKQASLALPSAASCLNQQSALAELSATQAAAVTSRGAPSHGWRACSSALGSVSWPLRLSLVHCPK